MSAVKKSRPSTVLTDLLDLFYFAMFKVSLDTHLLLVLLTETIEILLLVLYIMKHAQANDGGT